MTITDKGLKKCLEELMRDPEFVEELKASLSRPDQPGNDPQASRK